MIVCAALVKLLNYFFFFLPIFSTIMMNKDVYIFELLILDESVVHLQVSYSRSIRVVKSSICTALITLPYYTTKTNSICYRHAFLRMDPRSQAVLAKEN